MSRLAEIMRYADKQTLKHGIYVPEDYVPLQISGGFMNLRHIKEASKLGIQQVRSEFSDFVQVILDRGLNGNILEIGLGFYGGTHMVWRQIFNQVVTVEKSGILAIKFRMTEKLDSRSKIIVGDSHKINTFNKVKEISDQYDVVFIDGDHTYSGVMGDYFRYRGLVRKGGVIAFHDNNCNIVGFGVHSFIESLKLRVLDRNNHDIQTISHSKNVGIGYEII